MKSRDHQKSPETLAGMLGFEPRNGGIKIVCQMSKVGADSPFSCFVHAMRHQCLIALSGMILAGAACAEPSQPPSAPSCPYVIEDGDTIIIAETSEKIRLMGFDTPEIGTHAWCEAELRLGTLATRRLGDLLCAPGAAVGIARNAARPTDRYGRTLAVVTVSERDVAEVMISEGWARPYHGARRKGWCSRDSRDDLVPAAAP